MPAMLDAMLDRLARYARPILLVVPGLLTVGAFVTIIGLPLIGWTIYGVGYVGLLVALPAVIAVYRASLDRVALVAWAVLYVGVVLGLPVMAMVWVFYAQDPTVHEALLPYALTPLGMLAGVVAWVGLALFGLAAYRVRGLPTGPAWLFVVAAVIAVLAEVGIFVVAMWGLAILLASIALVWLAPTPESRAQATS